MHYLEYWENFLVHYTKMIKLSSTLYIIEKPFYTMKTYTIKIMGRLCKNQDKTMYNIIQTYWLNLLYTIQSIDNIYWCNMERCR